MLTVNRARKDLCTARFTRTAAARKKIRVRKRSALYLMHERGYYHILTYNPIERGRTVFTVKRCFQISCPRLYSANGLPERLDFLCANGLPERLN